MNGGEDDREGAESCVSGSAGGIGEGGGGKAPPVVSMERARELHGQKSFTMVGKFFGYRCIPVKKKNGVAVKCLLCGCLSNQKSPFTVAFLLQHNEED